MKKRLKIYDLRFMIFIFLFLFINHKSLFINPVYAVDSTPSADVKAKLELLKTEIASKAAKLKQEINQKLTNKAYIGKIKTKSENTVTLATKNGPRLVNINQDSEFESKITRPSSGGKGKKLSQKLLSEEDYLAALGDVDENGVLTARKIILLSPVTSKSKTYSWGQIVGISDKLATLKDRNLKNIAVSLPPSNAKLNDFVILTGTFNKNEIFEAGFVYVIPQGGILRPKKFATPSAKKK